MTTTPPDPQQPSYPGQQPPPAPYGAYPTDAAGAGRPTAPPAPPQPSSIALAVKLMWVGAALSLLSLIYSITTLGALEDDIEAEMRKSDPSVDQSVIDAVYGVTIAFAIVFGLLGAFLWVWMAWKNGQGRGWARVVATVFAGLNLLGLLFTAGAASTDALTAVSSIASVVLAGVIVFLLWRKESSQFYEGTAASRRLY
jgi:hypothetical protein